MLHIVGAYQSTFSFCDQPVQCLQKDKRMYKMLNLSESKQLDENRKIFLTYLKRTNKVCSPLFAAFVPVKPGRLSDVFLPISTNYVKKLSSDAGNKARIWSVICSTGAVLTDVVTLPVRLITFLPRVCAEILRPSSGKLPHPIKLLADTDDGRNPCIVVRDKEKFFFSLVPVHESEAKKYFDEKISELSNSALKNIKVYTPEGKQDLYSSETLSSPIPSDVVEACNAFKRKHSEVLERIHLAVGRIAIHADVPEVIQTDSEIEVNPDTKPIVKESEDNSAVTAVPETKQTDSAIDVFDLKKVITEIQKKIVVLSDFTKKASIEIQRQAHENAKQFLQKNLRAIGGNIEFVSPPEMTVGDVTAVEIKKSNEGGLNDSVFRFQYTEGVTKDIKNDGNRKEENVVVYGAASQFNGCEAPSKCTIHPGDAVDVYSNDKTQGPQAQLAFEENQVELINCGGNLGYNGLCKLLNDDTRDQIAHGYFSPSAGKEGVVIEQLEKNGSKIEYPCVVNKPQKGEKDVYLFLVAAPAFGSYCRIPSGLTEESKKKIQEARNQIQFLCALHAFRAQFKHCIDLAETTKKPVVFKPAAVGLGAFGNEPVNVAKAFYVAAKEYEGDLKKNNVKVIFQIFKKSKGAPDQRATQVATTLGLSSVPFS